MEQDFNTEYDDKVSDKYHKILEKNKEKIKSRKREFIAIGKFHNRRIRKVTNKNFNITVSYERLDTAIKSYFYDIVRYKDFHGMLDGEDQTNLNFPKIFAFSSKWILKEKPFYIYQNDIALFREQDNETKVSINKACNEVNEHILMEWMRRSHQYHSEYQYDLKLDKEMTEALIYNFKFRDINTGILELFFNDKCSPSLLNM